MERKEIASSSGYIVIYKSTVTDPNTKTDDLVRRFRFSTKFRFSYTIKGFAATIPDATYVLLKAHPDVDGVYEDYDIEIAGQTVSWGSKRIGTLQSPTIDYMNQPTLSSLHAFVLDTGVDQFNEDLNVVESMSMVTGEGVRDQNGHGTAIASIIAAKNNGSHVVGVAPGASIHSYKVLSMQGKGMMSAAIAGIDSVMRWKLNNLSEKRIVVCLAFSAFIATDSYCPLDMAISYLINANIPVVTAAGNYHIDAVYCTPAHCLETITVGSYNIKNEFSNFSNYGSCVDILAPGEDIIAAYLSNKRVMMTGTSVSAAFVAGAVGLELIKNPLRVPSQYKDALILYASANSVTNPAIKVGIPETINLSCFIGLA